MKKGLNYKRLIVFMVLLFVMGFAIFYDGERKNDAKKADDISNTLGDYEIKKLAQTGNPSPKRTGRPSPTGTGVATPTPKPCSAITNDTECRATDGCSWSWDDGHCAPSSACSIVGVSNVPRQSVGGGVTITVSYTGDCSDVFFNVTCKNYCRVNSSGAAGFDAGEGVIKTGVSVVASNVECTQAVYTVTGGGSKTGGFFVSTNWRSLPGVHYYNSKLPVTRATADQSNQDAHGSCTQEGNVWRCTNIEVRGCSPPGESSKPACYKSADGEYKWTADVSFGTKTNKSEADCINCYANGKKLSESTSTLVAESRDSAHPYLISESEATPKTCIATKVNFCEPTSITTTKQNKNATKCEDTVTITYQDGKECNGVSFYSIKCDNELKLEYDNGDDKKYKNTIKTTNSILSGQGFEYGINGKYTRTCNATFNEQNWKAAYNYVNGKISEVDRNLNNNPTSAEKKKLNSIKSELKNKIKLLKEYVEDYNNYRLDSTFDLTAHFAMTYKSSGKEKTLESDMTPKVISNGSGRKKITKKYNLNISGLTNPGDYRWETIRAKEIKLLFPRTYLDAKTGNITTDTKGLEGGNKLYVDYNADKGKYSMNITVSNNKGLITSMNTKMCYLNVTPPEVSYRPIDVSNPTINSSHGIGQNWSNSIYNFVSTIKETTWSERTQYNITLSPSQIVELKKSTSKYIQNGYSPYLGMCDTLQYSSQDNITKTICSIIK